MLLIVFVSLLTASSTLYSYASVWAFVCVLVCFFVLSVLLKFLNNFRCFVGLVKVLVVFLFILFKLFFYNVMILDIRFGVYVRVMNVVSGIRFVLINKLM